jgi:four helix bundle protein
MRTINSFKELKMWQKGMEIVKSVYASAKRFPSDEMPGLASLIKRSAVLIPSYIAEGFLRFYRSENQQSLKMALGCIAELETQLALAKDLEFLKAKEFDEIAEKVNHMTRMIIVSLKKINEQERQYDKTKPPSD